MQPDYYAVLEIQPTASPHEVRSSYRRLAMQYHPDRTREPGAVERFHAITEAYEVLSSPERRRAFDEGRRFGYRAPHRPKSASAERRPLTWLEQFFIQAGGIEAEGPGKGSLHRYSVEELDDIWHTIAARLAERGEVRQCIQRFQLLAHYIERHPDLKLPVYAAERLEEKRTLLAELEAMRKQTHWPWDKLPPSLDDLLRRHQFDEARALLLWRAVHSLAERLASSGLFDALPRGTAPVRELAMVDRIEAIVQGDVADRRLGHGYIACRRCRGWAMVAGVGTPRCVQCGSTRFNLRARDERDEWLERLLNRPRVEFAIHYNRWLAARERERQRWVWTPVFLTFLLPIAILLFWGGSEAASWLGGWATATGWWCGAWQEPDSIAANTDFLYPDERDWLRTFFGVMRIVVLLLLAWLALFFAVEESLGSTLGMLAGMLVVFVRPALTTKIAD